MIRVSAKKHPGERYRSAGEELCFYLPLCAAGVAVRAVFSCFAAGLYFLIVASAFRAYDFCDPAAAPAADTRNFLTAGGASESFQELVLRDFIYHSVPQALQRKCFPLLLPDRISGPFALQFGHKRALNGPELPPTPLIYFPQPEQVNPCMIWLEVTLFIWPQ